MTGTYRIVSGKDGGSGSFLCPPGHPRHSYSLYEYSSPMGRTVQSISAIDSALDDPDVPEPIRESVRRILASATLVLSESWLRNVYGYFRNSYAPESGSRNVSESITDRSNSLSAERHLAVLFIREYFPDHEPRLDLITNPGKGYGSYPCIKCKQPVQYEAKFDSWAVFGQGPTCPMGNTHAIEEGDPS